MNTIGGWTLSQLKNLCWLRLDYQINSDLLSVAHLPVALASSFPEDAPNHQLISTLPTTLP